MSNTPSKARIGALYIRVSTHGQEELSPDAQQRLLLEYAANNNIIISKEHIYIEGGISGRHADQRPQFKNMIARAKGKDHPFDVILVWKYSRFARNQEESIVYKSMLKREKVDVISISEPIIDGPFGSLIERIIEWMDEYYSIRLSGEVTRGMTENALRGNYQARPPLGYRIPGHRQPPVIIPEEAEIVRLIFNMYTEQGYGMFDIARRLNELGYQTAHKKPFERRSINYILQNPTYVGKTVWNRHDSKSNKKDKSDWIIADGKHDAIISKEQFEKAQQRIKTTYTPSNRKPSGVCTHWLSGIVKCSACGRTLTVSKQHGKSGTYLYLTCYGYKKGKCSVPNTISVLKAEPMVIACLESVISSGQIDFSIKKSSSSGSSETELLNIRLKELERKESRIKQAYRDGIDTIEEYRENKAILQNERNLISQRLEQASAAPLTPSHYKKIMLDRIRNVYNVVINNEIDMQTRNDAIKSVIEKIIFDRKTGTLDVYFYLSDPA